MVTIALVIEYNGAGFHGWQMQPGLRTVQGELHRVLELVTREKIRCVHSAGRTDTGVHAAGQVVSFDVANPPDLERLSCSVSSILRREVTVLRAATMDTGFHPRAGVKQKRYEYQIINRRTPLVHHYGFAWHMVAPLDLAALRADAVELEGEHDFTSFRAAGCQGRSPVKIIDRITVSQDGALVTIGVEGKGFLKQMVRIIVGTLVARQKGWPPLGSIREILSARDRTLAGPTAPAHGLRLAEVKYAAWPAIEEWESGFHH